MAKKEDAEPKEDYEFVPSDFDEESFIHKEMVGFRTTVILFLWGIVAAAISFALFGVMGTPSAGWWTGLLVVTTMGIALKWIFPATKTDISHWARREWLGTGFLFFFTWLAFFILFINPPVSDYAEPDVAIYASPMVQEVGGVVRIDIFLMDNGRVASHEMAVSGPSGMLDVAFTEVASGHFQATTPALDAGRYTVAAMATDAHALTGNATQFFMVEAGVVDVSVRDLSAPQDSVFVRVAGEAANLHAVYLEMIDRTCMDADAAGEAPCRVYLAYDEALGGWEATANMAGWDEGTNTFRVVAEEKHSFQGPTLVRGGRITAEGPYTVEVTTAVGTYADHVPRPQTTDPPVRDVPGPGVALLAAALVGIAFVARKRA